MSAELEAVHGVAAQLIAGSAGVFDVFVDDRRVFCKHELGRFPESGEIRDLLGS